MPCLSIPNKCSNFHIPEPVFDERRLIVPFQFYVLFFFVVVSVRANKLDHIITLIKSKVEEASLPVDKVLGRLID